jgi:hypothetical protein
MSVLPSPLINIMAEDVAESLKKWWPDCTAEKVIEQADTYDELTKWWIDALKVKSPDGEENVMVFPPDPYEHQVVLIDYDGTTYQYWYWGDHWRYIQARTTGMF